MTTETGPVGVLKAHPGTEAAHFHFSVSACNAAGCGERSERVALYAVDRLAPPTWYPTPEESIVSQSSSSIQIRWLPPFQWPSAAAIAVSSAPGVAAPTKKLLASGFRVYADDGVGGPIANLIYEGRPTDLSFVWTGGASFSNGTSTSTSQNQLTARRNYRFHVVAVNFAGESSVTATPLTVTAGVRPARMDAPFSKPDMTTRLELVVTWNVPDDGGAPITGYQLEKSTDGGEWFHVLLDATLAADQMDENKKLIQYYKDSAVTYGST